VRIDFDGDVSARQLKVFHARDHSFVGSISHLRLDADVHLLRVQVKRLVLRFQLRLGSDWIRSVRQLTLKALLWLLKFLLLKAQTVDGALEGDDIILVFALLRVRVLLELGDFQSIAVVDVDLEVVRVSYDFLLRRFNFA